MPQYGLLLRVTHTGKAGDSVHIDDVRDGIDVLGGAYGFRKPGPIYVPTPAKGGSALLVYSGDVAVSFETGGIRKFIEGGYLTAEFVIGDVLAPAIAVQVDDEGILIEPAATLFDFVGAGVTATQTAPGQVRIDVPGAAGGDHSLLSNLPWLVAGHTAVASPNTLAAFDGAGAAILITTTVSGDVTGTLPGPLAVGDFTIPGEVWGSILYFNGSNWVTLLPGTSGQVLTTQGIGATPVWTSNAGGDVTGPGSSTDEALVRWDGATGTLVQDSNVLLSDTGDMTFTGGTTLSVDNVAPATTNNGVVVNGIRNYGKLLTDPTLGPAAVDGDTYYNTALRMPMAYDGFRGKWLSVESSEFHFGRDGNTAAGQYYRAADGRIMGPGPSSSFIGWYAMRSGTVVSFAYTRSNTNNADFEIVNQVGTVLHTVSSTAQGGRDIAVNADFAFGDVLAVRNKSTGNTTSDVVGWLRVKWKV